VLLYGGRRGRTQALGIQHHQHSSEREAARVGVRDVALADGGSTSFAAYAKSDRARSNISRQRGDDKPTEGSERDAASAIQALETGARSWTVEHRNLAQNCCLASEDVHGRAKADQVRAGPPKQPLTANRSDSARPRHAAVAAFNPRRQRPARKSVEPHALSGPKAGNVARAKSDGACLLYSLRAQRLATASCKSYGCAKCGKASSRPNHTQMISGPQKAKLPARARVSRQTGQVSLLEVDRRGVPLCW
jgi:hypothetical protein